MADLTMGQKIKALREENNLTLFSRYEYGMQIALTVDQAAKAGIIPYTSDLPASFFKAADLVQKILGLLGKVFVIHYVTHPFCGGLFRFSLHLYR